MLKLFRQLRQPLTLIILLCGIQIPLRPEVVKAETIINPEVNPSPTQNNHVCPADLPHTIETLIQSPEMRRSRWGILIETLHSNQTLYALEADHYFIPASNVKLLTTAAALLELGAEYRFHTAAYATGTPPNLTSLRLVGSGDPSLTTAQLENLAQQLKNQGIEQIKELIIEDNYTTEAIINSTWEWGDIYNYYATSVNSLILNENTVDLKILPQKLGQSVKLEWSDPLAAKQWQIKNTAITAPIGTEYNININGVLGKPILQITGELAADSEPDIWGIAIPDPTNYFLESWQNILFKEGIKINRLLVTNSAFNEGREIAAIESLTLAKLLQKTNQESNNLYAEALGNKLAENMPTVAAIKEILTKLGVDADSYILVDASGLSRQNLVSPQAIVQTLQLMNQTSVGDIYQESLPIAGVSGTLAKRFLDTPVQGNLRGKTGTLTGVSALSGYLYTPEYEPLVFSIIVNQSEQSASEMREVIDQIVLLLINLNQC